MRNIPYRLQILAPSNLDGVGIIGTIKQDPAAHAACMSSMQMLRARTYLQDGAIQPWQIDEQGRHRVAEDERCWHFLLVNDEQTVIGCARYLLHPHTASFADLKLAHSPLAHNSQWASHLQSSVEADLCAVRQQNLHYAELGGWAIAEDYRNTRAALEIMLGTYAFGALVGHCIGSCTATVRNNSSSILRRIGGASYANAGIELPCYPDVHYGCTMELLRFDSRQPATRFQPLVEDMKAKLVLSPVLQAASVAQEKLFSNSLHALQSALAETGLRVTSITQEAFEEVKVRPV